MNKGFTVVELIIGIAIGLIIIALVFIGIHTHCRSSHKETQWQMPVSVVVGGGRYGGGVGIPVGNARQVETTVCDEYYWK